MLFMIGALKAISLNNCKINFRGHFMTPIMIYFEHSKNKKNYENINYKNITNAFCLHLSF